MREFAISRRYAKALFGLADKEGDLDRLDQDFLKIRQLIERHPEISHLVQNSTISRAEKEDFLDKIFASEADRLIVNFVKVLMRKKRFKEIFQVQEEFHRLVEKKEGIREVSLITAFSLTDALEARIKSILEKKWATRVKIRSEVSEDLLGGLIVRFEGQELDLSYRRRLEELKQKLLA